MKSSFMRHMVHTPSRTTRRCRWPSARSWSNSWTGPEGKGVGILSTRTDQKTTRRALVHRRSQPVSMGPEEDSNAGASGSIHLPDATKLWWMPSPSPSASGRPVPGSKCTKCTLLPLLVAEVQLAQPTADCMFLPFFRHIWLRPLADHPCGPDLPDHPCTCPNQALQVPLGFGALHCGGARRHGVRPGTRLPWTGGVAGGGPGVGLGAEGAEVILFGQEKPGQRCLASLATEVLVVLIWECERKHTET